MEKQYRLDEYDMEKTDWSEVVQFIVRNGTRKTLGKRELLLRQGERAEWVGYVEEGMLRHTRIDSAGNEHVVGYSFAFSLAGEYSACLCGRESLVNLQAVVPTSLYIIRCSELVAWWSSSPERERLGRRVAEQLFVMAYRRLIDSYCCTPEERYRDLMRQYPMLKERVPLKEIASLIGVTPETVSIIRRRLLAEKS